MACQIRNQRLTNNHICGSDFVFWPNVAVFAGHGDANPWYVPFRCPLKAESASTELLNWKSLSVSMTWRPLSLIAALTAGALQALDQLSAERRDLEKAYRWEWDNDDVIKGRAQGPAYDPDQPFREGLQRCEQRGVRVKLLAGGGCLWSGSLQDLAEARGTMPHAALGAACPEFAICPWAGLWASVP